MMAPPNSSSPAAGTHSGIDDLRNRNLGWLRTSVVVARQRAPRLKGLERKLSAAAFLAGGDGPPRQPPSILARQRRLAARYRVCPPEFVSRPPVFRAAPHSENPPPESLAWLVARIQSKWAGQRAPPSLSSPATRACRHCPPTRRPSTVA